MSETHSGAFPETRWSLILRLRSFRDDEAGGDALRELCGIYWRPLYASLRRSGHDPDSAMDSVQDFAVYLLHSDVLHRADHAKGRLRSYLLHVLRQFLIDRRRKATAQRRGGGRRLVPIDAITAEEEYLERLGSAGISMEEVFDRRWAHAVLTRAIDKLRAENDARPAFARLESALMGGSEDSLAELGAPLGLTPNAVSSALYRWRRRLRDLVIEELSQTVGSHADLDDELDYFLRVCSH